MWCDRAAMVWPTAASRSACTMRLVVARLLDGQGGLVGDGDGQGQVVAR